MRFLVALSVCFLAFATTARAQDFDRGYAAYKAGNFAVALAEWYPLAKHGYASAQIALAVMYRNGEGVPQDFAEAARWHRRAALQGHSNAQTNLAWMYFYGDGVAQDFLAAHMWFNIAAANGEPGAAVFRDMAARQLTRAYVAEAQRRARVCMASHYAKCG